MKKIMILILVLSHISLAEETVSEKTEAKAHDVKRSIKKKVHHVQENLCQGNDVECLKQKARHRTNEAGEYLQDKTQQIENKVDSDSSTK